MTSPSMQETGIISHQADAPGNNPNALVTGHALPSAGGVVERVRSSSLRSQNSDSAASNDEHYSEYEFVTDISSVNLSGSPQCKEAEPPLSFRRYVDGPSPQCPRRLGGEPGDPVKLLWWPSRTVALVQNMTSGKVGLAAASVDSEGQSRAVDINGLYKTKDENEPESVDVDHLSLHELEEECEKSKKVLVSLCKQDGGSRTEPFEVVKYLFTLTAPKGASGPLAKLREICSAAAIFLKIAQRLGQPHVIEEDGDSSTIAAEAKSFKSKESVIGNYLLGVSVLINLAAHLEFPNLEETSDYRQLVESLAVFSLCSFHPCMLEELLTTNTKLMDVFCNSLVSERKKPHMKMLLQGLCEPISIKRIHLVFGLLLVDGCIESQKDAKVQLKWSSIASKITKKAKAINPKLLLQVLAGDFVGRTFRHFDNDSVIDVISKVLKSWHHTPGYSGGDANAIWNVLKFFDSPTVDIRSVLKRVAELFGRAECAAALFESQAACYLTPEILRALLEVRHKPITAERLRAVHASAEMLPVSEEAKEVAMQTIEKMAFDLFYCKVQGRNDPPDCIATELQRTVSDDGLHKWVHMCLALALANGRGLIMAFKNPGSVAMMIDALAGYRACGKRLRHNLLNVITCVHSMVACDPLATITALLESNFLRQCQQEVSTKPLPALTLECTGRDANADLAVYPEDERPKTTSSVYKNFVMDFWMIVNAWKSARSSSNLFKLIHHDSKSGK